MKVRHTSPAVPTGLLRAGLLVACLLMPLLPAPGHAQESAEVAVDAALVEQVRELALHATQQTAAAQVQVAGDQTPPAATDKPLRFDVQIGALDPRLRLAPCQRIEPYLPPGMRLWGKARIGLRCAQGVKPWNVYLPITVRVLGQALVAATPLPAGATLREGDLRLAEVDFAEDNAAVVTQTALAVGRTLARPLIAGHSLRQTDLKPRMWFSAGDSVKVVASGPGFSVSGMGQALTPGIEGQTARVRTDNGQVVTGTPVGTRVVELSL